MITDRIGRHEVLLPISHKYYNFREKKNSLYERKGNFFLNYNFECDWLIELSDNKLSGNNLASELVENRSFLKPITIEEIVILDQSDRAHL